MDYLKATGLLLIFSATQFLSGADESTVSDIWRDSEHAGSNALLCYLRIHGQSVDEAEFSTLENRIGPPENVAEIVTIARHLGHHLEVRAIPPDDLNSTPLPAIVHFDGDNPNEGSFAVLLQVQETRMIFLDGGSAIISTQDREAFLRQWSGVVVINRRAGTWSKPFFAALGLFAGFVGASFF